MAEGLFHPRCRHGLGTYYPELEDIVHYETEDNKLNEYGTEELNRAHIENMIQKYKRLTVGSIDPANIAKYQARLNEWEGRKAQLSIANSENSDTIELKSNKEVREWYISEVSNISNTLDELLPLEEKAKQAFEKRNQIRSKAREIMADKEMRKLLETERPNMTFEELIASKMKRKGLTREEAQADILKTATKTNKSVNKELGLDGD